MHYLNTRLYKKLRSRPKILDRFAKHFAIAIGHKGPVQKMSPSASHALLDDFDHFLVEDPVPLDILYYDYKTYDKAVGRRVLEEFVGALVGKAANKGIFISLTTFTADAREYIRGIAESFDIRLIDLQSKKL